MSAKRALVVDDSRSARMFLARMLEKYAIDVDSAESAEQAIEYLTHHRPDVIFMDHLMPGMDGFQAVRTIKNNPRTATIPILMYTSQEGELYVGQARALGAVGVLPKQIRPVDVSKVLYQLRLLPERRTGEQSAFQQLNNDPDEIDLDQTAPAARLLTDAALREHLAELRRALVATLDGESSRIKEDIGATLETALDRLAVGGGLSRGRALWGWVAAAIVGIVAAASLSAMHRETVQLDALADRVAQLSAALASAPGATGT
ncbi:MAG: response regulator, partial [Steroidobacteraceae bacterium]